MKDEIKWFDGDGHPSTPKIDFDFIALIFVSVLLFLAIVRHGNAREVCPVRLDDKMIARIAVSSRGTVLSFPVKPTKVVLGKNGSFGIEYVENDLAISPLGSTSRSNLFVYLQGRRFSFDLFTDSNKGCAVVSVRDAFEVQTRVNFGGK